MAQTLNADAVRGHMLGSEGKRPRLGARILATLVAIAATALLAPAAHAVDLILLNGDPPMDISGVNNYDLVYVDNQLRLQGDTTINAQSVYLGPNSSIGPCFVGTSSNACIVGRNLTINATGSVTISNGFSLQPPSAATPRNGGNLSISAANITLGGSITTTGQDEGVPGNVSLTAAGTIDTQAITTRGGVVAMAGGAGVVVNGDIAVDADSTDTPLTGPGQDASGGHVDLSSASGDVFALGNVFADAINGSAGIAGGNGGTVKLTGRNVRVGFVDVGAGTGTDQAAGVPGSLTISAQGWAYVLGNVEATGSSSTSSLASGGGTVSITAGGHVGTNEIKVFGGDGPIGSAGAGGSITISGGSATLGNLSAWGGSGTSDGGFFGTGGNGGTVVVAAPGTVTLGAFTDAHGGSAVRPALAGLGGAVDVSAGDLTTGMVSTAGGTYSGTGAATPGVSGGPIKLSANGNLTASGMITSVGSNASSTADPAHGGGNGGPITLRAAAGTLTLGAQVRSWGGNGGGNPTDGQPGGPGGQGGSIDVVATALGPVASLIADGGDGGDFDDDQGPGGNGGNMNDWGASGLYSDQFVASNRGGAGNPNGTDGARATQGTPVGLTIDAAGIASFQSASPNAEGFHISRSIGNGPAELVATTTATSGIAVSSPVCQTALFSVVAYHNFLGWTSGSPAPVPYTTQPPGTQTCSDAPTPKIKKIHKKRFKKTPKKAIVPQKKLKRSKWRLVVNFQAKGIGTYDLAVVGPRKALAARTVKSDAKPVTKRDLAAKGKKKKKKQAKKKQAKAKVFVIATGDIPKAGLRKATVVLTKKARKPGAYTLRLRTFAPDGSAKKTLKVRLEVRK